jgi:predicted dehydrogenase
VTRRIYLVGAGTVANFHADAIPALPGDRTVAVADPDDEARAAFTDGYDARAFESAEAMLDEPAREDDIVVVATPPFVHRDPVETALASGRHVLCEKPLALNREEAAAMVSAAESADRLLGSCNCRFAGLPTTDRVRTALDDGTVGEPYHATFVTRQQRSRTGIEHNEGSRWFLDASRSGGGTLMDWGPYDAAILDEALTPEAVTVDHAWTARPETAADPDVTNDVEQHVGAAMRVHRDDGDLSLRYERAACTHGEPGSTYRIEGSKGAIEWEWKTGGEGEATVTVGRDVDGVVETETTEFELDGLGVHDKPLVYFDRVVRGESAPIATGRDALFRFGLLRTVYDAAAQGEPQECRR